MVRFGLGGASHGEPIDSAEKIPREPKPGLTRAMGEDEFLHQRTRLKRQRVYCNFVVFFLNPKLPTCEAADSVCCPASPSFPFHLHTSPRGRQKLAALAKTACSTASLAPPPSPEHTRTRSHSVKNREETQLATSYCPDGTPAGL